MISWWWTIFTFVCGIAVGAVLDFLWNTRGL